jgi:hypothetical protein
MQLEAKRLFTQLGVELDVNRIERGVSIADKQIVEIEIFYEARLQIWLLSNQASSR